MTKEQKILLLFVLAIATSSATFYVVQQKSSSNGGTDQITQTTGGSTSAPLESINTGTTKPAETGTVTTTPENKTYVEKEHFPVPNNFTDDITVTVIVDKAGNIVDVKFAYDTPTNGESEEYLGRFASKFDATTLIGKKISDAQISKTGRASLTTNAFIKALKAIGAKVTA